MSDKLFDNKGVVTDDVDVESVKQKFLKEDGTVDVEGLLKSKAHADKHIGTLEQKLDETKADRDQRLTYEKLMAEINATRNASRTEDNPPSERNQDSDVREPADMEAVKKLLEDTLSQNQRALQAEANERFVREQLVQVWGNDFDRKAEARAKELDLSPKFLRDLMLSNPKGFLNIMDAKPAQRQVSPSVFAPPHTRKIISDTTNPSKNAAYYKQLAKSDPKRYRSDEVQKEMYDQAVAQGEAFYS